MAKIPPPNNLNYSGMVVEVSETHALPGLDNLRAIRIAGMQALVGRDTAPGTVGILFPAEVQLSPEFCHHNNLFRHTHLNADPTQSGYLEDNRRLRALKLRGHRSDALFLPLTALQYITQDAIPIGTQFDTIDNEEICRKYEPHTRRAGVRSGGGQAKKSRLVTFPKHFDTTNYHRVRDTIDDDTTFILTQKLHGTSIRLGRVPARRTLSRFERIAAWFGANITPTEHIIAAGSRNVDKDPTNPSQRHFYDTDIWSRIAVETLTAAPRIPDDIILYGEVIGWAGSRPIQKGYTYNLPMGQNALYIYRVAVLTSSGHTFDLSDAAMRDFCRDYNLTPVPYIATMRKALFDRALDTYIDVRLTDFVAGAVPLSPESPCDEGICIRAESTTPQIYKLKSPEFLQYETKALDTATTEDVTSDE